MHSSSDDKACACQVTIFWGVTETFQHASSNSDLACARQVTSLFSSSIWSGAGQALSISTLVCATCRQAFLDNMRGQASTKCTTGPPPHSLILLLIWVHVNHANKFTETIETATILFFLNAVDDFYFLSISRADRLGIWTDTIKVCPNVDSQAVGDSWCEVKDKSVSNYSSLHSQICSHFCSRIQVDQWNVWQDTDFWLKY